MALEVAGCLHQFVKLVSCLQNVAYLSGLYPLVLLWASAAVAVGSSVR